MGHRLNIIGVFSLLWEGGVYSVAFPPFCDVFKTEAEKKKKKNGLTIFKGSSRVETSMSRAKSHVGRTPQHVFILFPGKKQKQEAEQATLKNLRPKRIRIPKWEQQPETANIQNHSQVHTIPSGEEKGAHGPQDGAGAARVLLVVARGSDSFWAIGGAGCFVGGLASSIPGYCLAKRQT